MPLDGAVVAEIVANRYRADLEDTQEAYTADVAQANEWLEKDLDTKKKNAAKKAAAAEAGEAPPE